MTAHARYDVSMSTVPSNPHVPRRATIQEYLQAEATSVEKHEYWNGYIVEMSGGTYEHSRINAQFQRHLGNALDGSPCFVLESNMRLRVDLANKYCYPDSMVVCGEPVFDANDPKKTTIKNPRVLAEVHSESTIAYDRSDKFFDYILVPGLEEVLMIWQDRPRIESYLRQADGTWSLAYAEGLEAEATIRALGVRVKLSHVYAGVNFPPAKKQMNTPDVIAQMQEKK